MNFHVYVCEAGTKVLPFKVTGSKWTVSMLSLVRNQLGCHPLIQKIIMLIVLDLFLTCMGILPVYVSKRHVCLVPAEVRRAVGLLELEFRMAVRHHVCAGN